MIDLREIQHIFEGMMLQAETDYGNRLAIN